MKSVVFFYNNIEGEEEIHEEEEAEKLRVGETIERDGSFWTVTKIDLQKVNELEPLDVLRVYLEPSAR
jgi:hypothetical protein